jgi:hypothetical protein
MARAETIWIVRNDLQLLAGFTVKHELETWLSKRDDRDKLLVFRLPDGGYGTAQLVSVRDLAIDKPSPWSHRKSWD